MACRRAWLPAQHILEFHSRVGMVNLTTLCGRHRGFLKCDTSGVKSRRAQGNKAVFGHSSAKLVSEVGRGTFLWPLLEGGTVSATRLTLHPHSKWLSTPGLA